MRYSMMRAEEFQLNLTNVWTNVGDQMLCSPVLKGLPKKLQVSQPLQI